MWSVLLFAVYVAVSCLGLYLIKSAPGWRTLPFVGGFALYAAGALLWLVILRLTPLSLAFPIAAGALMIGTLLTGVYFLDENVTAMHAAGALLIIAGITLIALKS